MSVDYIYWASNSCNNGNRNALPSQQVLIDLAGITQGATTLSEEGYLQSRHSCYPPGMLELGMEIARLQGYVARLPDGYIALTAAGIRYYETLTKQPASLLTSKTG